MQLLQPLQAVCPTFACLILIMVTCSGCQDRPPERTKWEVLNDVRYGVIYRKGFGGLEIAISRIDSMPLEQINQFAYCLENLESKSRKEIHFIKIYKHFYYIDQVENQGFNVIVNFKYIPDKKDPTIARNWITSIKYGLTGKEIIYEYPDNPQPVICK